MNDTIEIIGVRIVSRYEARESKARFLPRRGVACGTRLYHSIVASVDKAGRSLYEASLLSIV